MNALLSLLALCGHVALWVAGSNRLGASGWNYHAARWLRKTTTLVILAGPLLIAWSQRSQLLLRDWWLAPWPYGLAITSYAMVCWVWFSWIVVAWCRRTWRLDSRVHPANIASQQFLLSEQTDQPWVKGWSAYWMTRLPANQVLSWEVNRKQLMLSAYPAASSGLTITHLSDIHISHRFTHSFYDQLLRQVNQLQSDVIAITGDLVDLDPVPSWAIEWYGQLVASAGVFFILGNHDFRKRQQADFRDALADQGLVDLGNQGVRRHIDGVAVDLMGNELPWSETAPRMMPDSAASAFSVALAHSPDQFGWAQQHDVDLLLAGHMHGGQICFPIIGPLVGPSRHGVTYSAGCFKRGPTTMHVSRGAGGLVPIRWNCRPEITQLEIRPAT